MIVRLIASIPGHWLDVIAAAGIAFALGYGLGARWRSPAGPLAIDLAWGHQERSLRLHFGVAVAF